MLTPDMFGSDLSTLYSELKNQYEATGKVDSILAGERVNKSHVIPVCMDIGAKIHHAEDYAEIVRENWRTGNLYKNLVSISDRLQDGSMAKDVIPMLQSLLEYQEELEKSIQENNAKAIKECFLEYMALLNNPPNTIKTGFRSLDYITGGFLKKGLYVIGARPGKGKTDFALNIALNLVNSGYRVNYNTMEMPRHQCTQRILSNLTRINEANLRDRELSQEDMNNIARASEALCTAPLILDDKVRMSPAEVKSRILKYRPDVIILDNLQIMDMGNSDKAYEAVAKIMPMLKKTAMDYNVVIILPVQEKREADKGGAPTMGDLYGGAAVEANADGAFIIRNESTDGRMISGTDYIVSKIHIVKNRHGGGEGMAIPFMYQPQYHRFLSIDTKTQEYGHD